MYKIDAIKIPLHNKNFFNKLNRKNTGRFINTHTFINDGKTDKSLALAMYSFQGR